jgi:hypothetical protein
MGAGLEDYFGAAQELGGGALDRAQSLEGLAGDADLGGADFANFYGSQIGGDMIANSLASSRTSDIAGQTMGSGYSISGGADPSGVLGMSNNALGGGVGALGGYLGTQLMGGLIGKDQVMANQAIGGSLGAMAGAYGLQAMGYGSVAGGAAAASGGAAATGAATGAAAGAGTGAAGAAMGAGAMAIPLAIAMSIYGTLKEERVGSKARKTLAGQMGNYLTPQSDGGALWTNPFSGSTSQGQQYYMNKASYDNLYSGDIGEGYKLYDPNQRDWMAGELNWNTGKVQTRQELRDQEYGNLTNALGGLSTSQQGEMTDLYNNTWDTTGDPSATKSLWNEQQRRGGDLVRSSTLNAPYTLTAGNRGGDAGTSDPAFWVNSQTGDLASYNPTPDPRYPGNQNPDRMSESGQGSNGLWYDYQGKNITQTGEPRGN